MRMFDDLGTFEEFNCAAFDVTYLCLDEKMQEEEVSKSFEIAGQLVSHDDLAAIFEFCVEHREDLAVELPEGFADRLDAMATAVEAISITLTPTRPPIPYCSNWQTLNSQLGGIRYTAATISTGSEGEVDCHPNLINGYNYLVSQQRRFTTANWRSAIGDVVSAMAPIYGSCIEKNKAGNYALQYLIVTIDNSVNTYVQPQINALCQ